MVQLPCGFCVLCFAPSGGANLTQQRVSGAKIAEWSQHAHDAQRTGYTSQVVPPPWRLRWIWNGVDSQGGVAKVTTSGSLPRNVQPVTGGGRVYVAAGVDGVFALSEINGRTLWRRNGIGDVRSTVAYDHDTQSVFTLASNGTLYRLDAKTGVIRGVFRSHQSSALPLPPAIAGSRVWFAIGDSVYCLNKFTMRLAWRYNTGSTVATPPSYSVSRNLVVVGCDDLSVHGIDGAEGTRRWRRTPIPSGHAPNSVSFRYGWPVIAENAGIVLLKAKLPWSFLWADWAQTNAAMRQFLQQNPTHQALFALRLDDGATPFICHVGHGGYGDNDYLPMGPQPVVKRFPNGKEVAYTIIRARHAYDSRWDSHFGEMMLDDDTVPGLLGGYVRFIAFDYPPGSSNPFLLTDEQPYVSMAGDYLFGGHWEAGFALRIVDRSNSRGGFSNPISTQRLATIATSQDNAGCPRTPSHYCSSNLENTREYDFGFYIYYGQGAVYDQYWSEYACHVVSNGNLYFRSCDGAIVALTHGQPAASREWEPAVARAKPPLQTTPETILHTQAREWAGCATMVEGVLQYVFNNGKKVMLGFHNPHQGHFKVIIRKEDWAQFKGAPERLYHIGQAVRVAGVIQWYQGDPAIYATAPEQIETG
ncbi:MAG: pyrrolo-quinoline quinone [Fimbriimonadales bacterium]|nr:MAG: pyrrolo-quinoline quinone [Fimbriimonadales bacterium]